MAPRTLYVLYNADASIMGKLKYGYRKLCKSSEDNPACAACDITHGGLSLQETPAWVEARKVVEAESRYKVVQQHRDELSSEVREFVKTNGVRYPTVLVNEEKGELREVMNNLDLAACKGDAQSFLSKLQERGILQQKQTSASL